MKKVVLLIIAILVIFVLGILTVFGKHGFIHLTHLKTQLREIELKNNQLTAENKKLRTEIDLLKNNSKYLEEVARKELGLIKEGEIIYHIEPKDK